MRDEAARHKQIENQDDIILTLPLLDYVSNLYSLERNRPFSGHKILAVQHLLGSQFLFLPCWKKAGQNQKTYI